MPLRPTPGAKKGARGARTAVYSAVLRVAAPWIPTILSLSLAGYPDLRTMRTIAPDNL